MFHSCPPHTLPTSEFKAGSIQSNRSSNLLERMLMGTNLQNSQDYLFIPYPPFPHLSSRLDTRSGVVLKSQHMLAYINAFWRFPVGAPQAINPFSRMSTWKDGHSRAAQTYLIVFISILNRFLSWTSPYVKMNNRILWYSPQRQAFYSFVQESASFGCFAPIEAVFDFCLL